MKPLILLTNDDGVLSPGLAAVAAAVRELGDLLIAAPRYQQTSMSRAMVGEGIIEPLLLTINGAEQPAYGIHGAPARAVVHGIFELAARLPDLCISGINYGENIGMTAGISGTIGAALEANVCGIPALAVSQETPLDWHHKEDYPPVDWSAAAHFTRHFAEVILKKGLPLGAALLNISLPEGATPATPFRYTVQSQQNYFYFKKGEPRDWSKPHRLKLANVVDHSRLEPNSDIQALVYDRVVSVTPMMGNLTARIDLSTWQVDEGVPE